MMSNKSRYCLACKKYESQDECKYGPVIWRMTSIDESYINEARKRDKVEAGIFTLAALATMAQSPKEFVKFGYIQSPGVAIMDRIMQKKQKATVSGLDNKRVSDSARNKKIKNPPTILSTIGKVPGISEGRVHAKSPRYPLKSGWMPIEKTRAKLESLRSSVFRRNPDPRVVERYKKLLAAHEALSNSKPPSEKERYNYRLDYERGINIGRTRRHGINSQERLMPRARDLPQNKNRIKYYKMDLSDAPRQLGEELDKKLLALMLIKKMINDKKRKNFLLNYGYIGEAKTPAWSRNEGKDLEKGGLNKKGIESYRRENPGSKLSMAVTTEPSKLKKGSKRWKRRKSFCSRSAGQMRMWPKAAKDPNSRLRLARRKWNC